MLADMVRVVLPSCEGVVRTRLARIAPSRTLNDDKDLGE